MKKKHWKKQWEKKSVQKKKKRTTARILITVIFCSNHYEKYHSLFSLVYLSIVYFFLNIIYLKKNNKKIHLLQNFLQPLHINRLFVLSCIYRFSILYAFYALWWLLKAKHSFPFSFKLAIFHIVVSFLPPYLDAHLGSKQHHIHHLHLDRQVDVFVE